MLYYAWSRSLFLEVGQAHSKYNLLLLLYYNYLSTFHSCGSVFLSGPHSIAAGLHFIVTGPHSIATGPHSMDMGPHSVAVRL